MASIPSGTLIRGSTTSLVHSQRSQILLSSSFLQRAAFPSSSPASIQKQLRRNGTGPVEAMAPSFLGKPWGGSSEPEPSSQPQWQQSQPAAPTPSQPAVQGQTLPGGLVLEKLLTVETNIDDMSPQIMAYTSQKLLEAGAVDVWTTPTLMKKGRPGLILHALCSQEKVNSIMTVMFYESTSLGVRITPCDRVSMQRLVESVRTQWGFVPVKAAFINGQLVTATAEYEACAEVARAKNVPLKLVKAAAENAYVESEKRERQSLER